MLLSEAFSLYARDVIAFRNQSRKTEEQHYCDLKSLVTYIGNPEVDKLTFEQIRLYKHALERRGLTSGTIRGYLNKLTVVLGWLQKNQIRCLDPDLIPLPKRDNRPVDFLQPEEVTKLIGVAGLPARGYPLINRYRNQAIIATLYASGVRIGELVKLDRDSIHNSTFTVYGKGNKARIAFIDERAERYGLYLKQRSDSSPALFWANQTRTRLTSGQIQTTIREIGKKAGFEKPIHPHIFRHSYATNLTMNGIDMFSLMKIMGHTSLQTTQIYLHVYDKHLAEDYEKYHTL